MIQAAASKNIANKYTPIAINSIVETEDVLGPLPENWERCPWGKTRYLYVDHETKMTTWVDPRTFHLRKHDIREIVAGELPYAWEELWNNDCGIYYVDHITQTHYFEAPWSEVTRKRVLAIHDSLTLQAKELENQLELEREKREILELAEKKLATLEIQKHQIEEEIKHVQSSKGQTSKVNKLQGELQAVKYKLDCEKNEVLKVRRDHEILVEEIDAFQNKIRDLKTVNERLESENHKLAVEAKATNEAIADMKTMIEMEAAQRQALESYIKQLKQDVMMLYDEKEVTVENVDKSVKEAEGKADFEEEEPAWLKAANKNHVKAKEVDAISRNSSTSTDEEA